VTIVQARAADAVRSRVFAAQDGAAHVAFSVSAFTGGLLVQLVGPRAAFGTATAFATAAALLAASRYRESSGRPETRNDGEADPAVARQ
jgi:predicted MFS family arabinose efflux permease